MVTETFSNLEKTDDMKLANLKCIVTVFLLALAATAAAQGWVTLDNSGNNNFSLTATSSGRVFIPRYGQWTLVDEDLNIELLGGSDSAHLMSLAVWLLSDGSAQGDSLGDGLFRDPAGRSFKVTNYVPIPMVVTLEVRAWAGLQPSFALAATFGGVAGDTGPFQNPVSQFQSAPASLIGMPALLLGIPEPSSLALAIIGASLCLTLCRRTAPAHRKQ